MILLNGNKITPTIFPDKTSQIWQLGDFGNRKDFAITWEYDNEGELMHVAQLNALLLRYFPNGDRTLHMPYLPYARQDKVVSDNTTFALSIFCRIINQMQFDKVTCLDAHSNVADTFINDFLSIEPDSYINMVINTVHPTLVCFPDVGALNRYANTIIEKHKLPFVVCRKNRDQKTGEITGMELLGTPKDHRVLIIDDICDGGRTFIEAGQLLWEHGATKVNLYTTHGIYSKGLDPLHNGGGIGRVFNYKGEMFQNHDKQLIMSRWEDIN